MGTSLYYADFKETNKMSYKKDLPEDVAQAMEMFRSWTTAENGYTLTDRQIIVAALRKLLKGSRKIPGASQITAKQALVLYPVLEKDWSEVFDFSYRTQNALRWKVVTVLDLVVLTEARLLKFKNFGRKSLNEVKLLLFHEGLHLGMRFKEEDKGTYEQFVAHMQDLERMYAPTSSEMKEAIRHDAQKNFDYLWDYVMAKTLSPSQQAEVDALVDAFRKSGME
jgi:hypothetical protein